MFISTSAHPPHTLVNKGGESGLQAPTDFKEKPKSFSRQNVERVNNWLSVDRWAPDLNLSDCLSVCMSAPPSPLPCICELFTKWHHFQDVGREIMKSCCGFA